ncbi:MAG: (d)CMP kinase [Gemmatimonadota bacterium]
MHGHMIIAIDGPAGSGKSSTAKAVADRLGYRHLDSGAFYRAITFAALERGIPVESWPQLDAAALNDLDVHAEPGATRFELYAGDRKVTDRIRSPEVNEHVSQMAALPAVRDWLLIQLRATALSSDLVADGRDIGTVVFPDAGLKVFLIAQSETRARRRLAEHGVTDPSYVDIQNEVDRLGLRDRLDSQRTVAPLKQALDAVVIDTTSLTFEEQVDKIVGLAAKRGSRG